MLKTFIRAPLTIVTAWALLLDPVSFGPVDGKEKPAATDAKTFARLNQAQLVFTAKVTRVERGAVAYTDPPGFSDDLEFGNVTILRGVKPAKMIFIRNVTQPTAPEYPRETTWVVAADFDGKNGSINFIAPVNDKLLALARKAVELPLGWMLDNDRPVSPWAALGRRAWPKDALSFKGPTCFRSGRPALFAGEQVEITAEQVLPKKRLEFKNPFGNGQFKITVANRSDKPITVPALLTDGKTIFWEDSLAILVITDGSGPHVLPGAGKVNLARFTEARAVKLKQSESVSTIVNVLPLQGVSWPRGGWRMYFRFCLGEKSAINFFYYASDFHDPLRAAATKASDSRNP